MVSALPKSAIKAPQCEVPIVTVSELSKRFKSGTHALREVTFEINKGDLFGLIGPDGAGKSTALSVLSGVMEPTSGEVRVLESAPRDARRHIGYVPQNCGLYPELTVEENLRYQAGLYGISDKMSFQKINTLLKRMGLLQFSDRLTANLSGGMKQKLALCCALISEPQLILLDEPTTGLDPIVRREFWQALTELAQEGVTAVIATPFLDEAERCNSIALMYEGKIHQTGTPDELRKALQMRRLDVTIGADADLADVWSIVRATRFKYINDIYLYGDHLEILATDVKAAEAELREAVPEKNIEIKGAYETAPTLENVFVMRMRELGYKESATAPFPLIRTQVSPAYSAIKAKGLCKNFQEFQAVDNLDLEIKFGEIYGLLGANGAGKTTAIKMLCGLMEPTTGVVSLAGQIKDLRSKDVCRRIGYMSQRFTLYDGLTVEENLQFYAAIYEIPLKLRKRQIDWVTQVGAMGDIRKSVVGRLPLGWKQRIAFGAAVMHEPDIIFLDEPTAGVDPLARRQLWNLIRDFAGNGAAILVTTHYLDEAEFCNRLAFMAASKIVAQGTPREIKSQFQGQLIEIKADNTHNAYRALVKNFARYSVSIFGDAIHIQVTNVQRGLEELKTILQVARCDIRSIRPIPCSLEDAFIDVVERSQREAT